MVDTILALEPELSPVITSSIATVPSKLVYWKLGITGSLEFLDSNTALILNTSAVPRDILVSSTLLPKPPATVVNPFTALPVVSSILRTFIRSVVFAFADLSEE